MQKIMTSFHAKQSMNFAENSVDKNPIKATNIWLSQDYLKWSVFGTIDQTDKKQITYPTVPNLKHWCMAGKIVEHARVDSGVGHVCQKTMLGSRRSIAYMERQILLWAKSVIDGRLTYKHS